MRPRPQACGYPVPPASRPRAPSEASLRAPTRHRGSGPRWRARMAAVAEEVRNVTRRMRAFPEDSWTFDRARNDGAYEAARKAVTTMAAEDVTELVKAS